MDWGTFRWISWGPRDKDNTLGGTDGPLSTQINQTPLTPSALSNKSHWLQWHLLLGAQLYNLVSPTRFSKADTCSTDMGASEQFSGVGAQSWMTQVSAPHVLASEPVTQGLLRGQQSSPLGYNALPQTKGSPLATILHQSLEGKPSWIRTQLSLRITSKVEITSLTSSLIPD